MAFSEIGALVAAWLKKFKQNDLLVRTQVTEQKFTNHRSRDDLTTV